MQSIDPPTKLVHSRLLIPKALSGKVFVSDCSGHGRALELLLDVFPGIPADIGPEVKSLMANELAHLYRGVLPGESDSIPIVKAVLTNRRLWRYSAIPRTHLTPDEVCQNGLICFADQVSGLAINPSGYFNVPYIWSLALCLTYKHNRFFDELQLLDYQDFLTKDTHGVSSWADFEKSMVKFVKSSGMVV